MKVSDFLKKIIGYIVVFFSAIVTFVFYRNRRQRLDQNKQLCSAVGEGVTSAKESIGRVEDSVKGVSDRIGRVEDSIGNLAEQSKSVADIVREYNEGEFETKGDK